MAGVIALASSANAKKVSHKNFFKVPTITIQLSCCTVTYTGTLATTLINQQGSTAYWAFVAAANSFACAPPPPPPTQSVA